MPIPKNDPAQIYRDDLVNQEQNPDTVDVKFYEPCPFNKTLFKVTPGENGTIRKIGFSFGPNDASLNGYILVAITRMENVNLYLTAQAQNQIIWSKIFFKGDTGVEHLNLPVYLYANEPIYIQAISNFPAPCKALGQITLTVMPAFR